MSLGSHLGFVADAGQNRSQSLRSVARGGMGLSPADPLLRQNEEVLQVRKPTPCFHLFGVTTPGLALTWTPTPQYHIEVTRRCRGGPEALLGHMHLQQWKQDTSAKDVLLVRRLTSGATSTRRRC